MFNLIPAFIFSILSNLWNFFRSFSPRVQVAIVLFVLIAILVISAVGYHFYSINKLQTVIESQKEGIAIKDQREIDQAKETVSNSEAEANKTIQTDSNKFSKSPEELTNKFCSYYCDKLHVLDSSCVEWARKNNKVCN
ncbi:MAG TPA: hypothetical protein PKY82_33295 [Pyrinomonadaceae bacterium]|nr:hypothetical protein [Pyrinomonadaceae bacterium]